MFKKSRKVDDVTFSAHMVHGKCFKSREKFSQSVKWWMFYLFCSGSKIILDIYYFNFLQVSAIHVFLAWKPNLDPGGCSLIWSDVACRGIWAGICRWTTGHCFLPLCTTGHINSCESVNRVLGMIARYTKPFVLNEFKIKRRAFLPMS